MSCDNRAPEHDLKEPEDMCSRLLHWFALFAAVLQLAVWIVGLAMVVWILSILP
jgi:hypothetical protein